jgi:hypothetical protein
MSGKYYGEGKQVGHQNIVLKAVLVAQRDLKNGCGRHILPVFAVL